jgi:hypothetical protein
MTMRSFSLMAVVLAGVLTIAQAPFVAAQDPNQPDQGQQAPEQAQPQDMQGQYPPSANGDQASGPAQPGADDQNQAPAQDPPSRIARLNFSQGSVSFQPGGEGDWVDAVQNRPLTTGDNLWADKSSRAELHVGSTAIRMDSETSLTFLELDDRTTQLKLSMGTLILDVRHLDDQDLFEVDTPNLAFTIQRIGEYRIDVNEAGNQTITTVFKGRGEVTGGGESYVVVAGQRAQFDGTDQLNHDIAQLPPPDDFSQWAFGRDKREDSSETANYISPEMTGYEDLDDYGKWDYAADYGPVWRPTGVEVGWAPYRNGHWVFVAPWGWTWVESEPWGFAPFHYGRWAFAGAGWCWVPGPVVVRPVYAPALVAFVGGGPGFGIGVSWFPLAPREVYVPWYRGSRGYVNNVNITNTRVNVTQVTNVYNTTIINNNTTVNRVTYANQRVPTAITSVSRDTFVNARPVARNLQQVDTQRLSTAPVNYRPVAQPTRASVVGSGGPAKARPVAAVINRQVVATRNPTPPRPSFEQRQTPNVRTEGPANPRPVTNQPGMQPNRGGEAVRPGQTPQQQPVRPGQPNPQARPEVPAPQTRPAPEQTPAPRAEQPVRPQVQPPTQQRPVPRPENNYDRGSAPSREPSPQVRPAPPVQNRPEVQRSEEQKFSNWQQQRQSAPRPQAPPRQESRPSAPRPSSPPKR